MEAWFVGIFLLFIVAIILRFVFRGGMRSRARPAQRNHAGDSGGIFPFWIGSTSGSDSGRSDGEGVDSSGSDGSGGDSGGDGGGGGGGDGGGGGGD